MATDELYDGEGVEDEENKTDSASQRDFAEDEENPFIKESELLDGFVEYLRNLELQIVGERRPVFDPQLYWTYKVDGNTEFDNSSDVEEYDLYSLLNKKQPERIQKKFKNVPKLDDTLDVSNIDNGYNSNSE